MFTATVSLFMLFLCVAKGEYQSAGCSDVGCGIPCYLRPPEDNCHYIDHNPCGNDQPIRDVDEQLYLLNVSLVRLQEKLIQKGVSKCRILPQRPHPFIRNALLLIECFLFHSPCW